MPNILRLNKISPLANKVLPASYKLVDECAAPDAIILRSFKMHDYALPESLLMVARAGAGVNNIPVDKCSEKGIVVFNTPGANANAVKELVICSLFLCGRKVVDGINWTQNLAGQDEVEKKVEDGKKDFIGGEIMGKTLGVVGLGAIGILTANAAVALGMNVIGHDPFLTPEKQKTMDSRIKIASGLDEIYASADFISLHVPLADNTRGMINKATLAKCKDGVNVINCARGELCDNAAIIEGLSSGKINRYVTDFPSKDLLGVKNLITIPHLGASTPEAEDNCAVMACEEMVDFLDCGNIRNSVNFPNVSLECCATCDRLSVVYKGEVDVAAEAKKLGINVKAIACGNKKGFGYALISTDTKGAEAMLKGMTGALKVRSI